MTDLSPLKGARIWLSGAISPEFDGAAVASFKAFVTELSALIFKAGGSVVHGSHPSIRDTLLAAAERHQAANGARDCLVMAASKFHYAKYAAELPDWQTKCVVHQEPAVDNDRDKSLARLRAWMADHADAMVGIGGKWWKENPAAAGIPQEFELARERGLPCFLLGGLGGAAAGYLERLQVLPNLRNGLDQQQNERLAGEQDVAALAAQVVAQLARLPLLRGDPLGKTTFRILALDGGGIKGTFTAAVLATWEKLTGLKLAEHFDLIAGTSTGGILALGLGMGLSADDILKFYVDRGPTVFPVTSLRDPNTGLGDIVWNVGRRLFRPKFDSAVLRNELAGAFGGAKRKLMDESVCRLVIPTVRAYSGSVHVFRTNHHPDLVEDWDLPATDAALATAAAPTYFRAATIRGHSYLDGGLWANNPTLVAVAEAAARLNVPLGRIDILSVGTTSVPYAGGKENAGIIDWLKGGRIVDLLMHTQALGIMDVVGNLAGRPRVLRVDQTLIPGRVSLDNVSRIPELRDRGGEAAVDGDMFADVKARFLNGIEAEPWTKYRPGGLVESAH